MLTSAGQSASAIVSILHEISAIVGVLVWPAFALFVILRYRDWIAEFLPVITEKIRDAESLEIAGLKLSKAQNLVEAAINQPETKIAADERIPDEQVKNAEALRAQLQSAGVGQKTILVSVEEQIIRFSTEYQSLRFLPSGPQRRAEMNRVMGGLRTLGIAAKPLLPKLTISARPGDRLAAIAVLQTEPDPAYLNWLLERFSIENPFVFFHAALALRQAALVMSFVESRRLRDGIKNALATIEGYTGGRPDQATINALRDTLAIIEKREEKQSNS